MSNFFCVDSNAPTAHIEIRDYLLTKLNPILKENRPLIFLCVGTDRSTGDSLGPIIGYKLKYLSRKNLYFYGTLENPVHSKNLASTLEKIYDNFNNPFIIGIDACLGNVQNIGKIYIDDTPLMPGTAVNKNLPSVGDMSITGIVNISGSFEYLVLQNTRLHTVMKLADIISNGILYFVINAFGGNTTSNNETTLDTYDYYS